MRLLTIMIFTLVAIGSIGTSYALITHDDNVLVNGNLTLNQGNFIVQKSGGADSGLSVKNTGGGAVFQFQDVDNPQVYRFKLNKLGTDFQFIDFTHARTDLTIKTSNGNIGVGTTNPQERLDVNGNINVQGNIVSSGDICIGTCP